MLLGDCPKKLAEQRDKDAVRMRWNGVRQIPDTLFLNDQRHAVLATKSRA